MKKTDIAMLVLIAGVSVLCAYMFINTVFAPSEKKETIDTMEAISKEVSKPSSDIFHKDAINPTQTVHVGENK